MGGFIQNRRLKMAEQVEEEFSVGAKPHSFDSATAAVSPHEDVEASAQVSVPLATEIHTVNFHEGLCRGPKHPDQMCISQKLSTVFCFISVRLRFFLQKKRMIFWIM